MTAPDPRPLGDPRKAVDRLYDVSVLIDAAEARLRAAKAQIASLMVDTVDGMEVVTAEEGDE